MRLIPGARFAKELDRWTIPLSWASCRIMRGVIGAELEVGPKLAEWARLEKARRVDPALALREAHDLPPEWGWGVFFDRIEGGAA